MTPEEDYALIELRPSSRSGLQLTRASLTRFELSSDDTLLVSKPANSLSNKQVSMTCDLLMQMSERSAEPLSSSVSMYAYAQPTYSCSFAGPRRRYRGIYSH